MNYLNKLFFRYVTFTKKKIVKVPSWITHIPSRTFDRLPNLKEVHFCGELNEIQKYAFRNCPSLKIVRFSKKVDHISEAAFENAENISFMFSYSIPKPVAIKMRSQLKKADRTPKRNKSNISKKNDAAEESAKVKIIDELNDAAPETDVKADEKNEIKSIVEKAIETEITEESIIEVIEKSELEIAADFTQEFVDETIDPNPSNETVFDEIPVEDKPVEISEITDEAVEAEPLNETVFDEIPVENKSKEISEITDEAIETEQLNETVFDEIQVENKFEEISEITDKAIEAEPLNESDIDEIKVEQPSIEEFDRLVLDEKNAKESKSTIVKRNRTLANESKENLRKKDLKKYSSSNSLTDIKTNDVLTSKLIERYTILENKYSYHFPLGLIDVSKEEFNAIVTNVRAYIEEKSAVTVLSGFISTLFLVKTVENYGIKGDFWRSVSTLLNCSETEAASFLKEAMLSFCSSEKLYFHYYDNIHSYTGTILIHAVIGADDLDNTLDFLRNFYIEEMYETYSKETIASHISDFIQIMAADIDNNIKEVGDLSGIYKVSFNLKNACRVFPEAMTDIMKCLLFNINAYYHRLSDASYSPTVFYKYFKRWCINDIRRSRTAPTKKNIVRQRSEIKNPLKQVEKLSVNNKCSYFIDENNELFLYIPQFEVPSEAAHSKIITHFYDGFNMLSKYELENEVFGIFRFRTSEQTVKLSNFYKELNIKIESENGDIIFDSRSQLFRKYIVFDSDLTEITARNIPDDRFYILTEKESDFFADDNYNSYPKSNYFIHSLDVEKDCDITVDLQRVFKNCDENSDVSLIVDSEYRNRNAKILLDAVEYRVYTGMPHINIECSKEIAEEYIIDINDRHIALSEISNHIIDPAAYTDSRYITVVLRKKGSLRYINEWNMAVVKGFEFTLDKKFYYREKTAELLDIYADDIDFEIQDFPYTFPITRSKRLTISANDNGRELTFELKLPVIYWEISEAYNSISGTKYVSASSVRDKRFITLEIPVNNAQIMAVNEKMSRQLTISNHKVDISDFHNSVSDYTTFGVYSREIGQIILFELIYNAALRDISVVCSGDQLIISYISIGKCPLNIVIKDISGKQIHSKSYSAYDEGENNITEEISELPDGVYDVELYKLQADMFGFSSDKKLVETYRIVKGSPFEVFLSANKNVLKPEYCFFDGDEKKRVHNFYCEDIEKPDMESEIYSANAFFYNRNGDKVYLKDANPMRVELLEKNDRFITFTMTDCDNDGLLYEKARGYLVSDSEGLRDYNSYSLPDHYAIKI